MDIYFKLADQVLHGLDEIASYLKVSRRTTRRWIDDIGLPAFQLPSRAWMTSTRLIDQWILAASSLQREERKKEKHFEDLIKRTQ
jgi:excisionase family DNA binding protein